MKNQKFFVMKNQNLFIIPAASLTVWALTALCVIIFVLCAIVDGM